MIVLRKNSNNFSVKIGKSYIPINESLIPYLCDEMEIQDGVTFGDFFEIIFKHHEEYSKVFYSHLGGIPLSDFLIEWLSPIKKEIHKSYADMERLIIEWENIPISDEKELYDEENGLEISWLPSFSGTGNTASGGTNGYAIEFTPINELKKYPLQLVENILVYNIKTNKKLIFIEKKFTVYEILSAIFYEITFMGNPKARQKKFKEIVDMANMIEDGLEKENTSKSLDEILKKLNIDKPREENQ